MSSRAHLRKRKPIVVPASVPYSYSCSCSYSGSYSSAERPVSRRSRAHVLTYTRSASARSCHESRRSLPREPAHSNHGIQAKWVRRPKGSDEFDVASYRYVGEEPKVDILNYVYLHDTEFLRRFPGREDVIAGSMHLKEIQQGHLPRTMDTEPFDCRRY
jgi:hypothetical protein